MHLQYVSARIFRVFLGVPLDLFTGTLNSHIFFFTLLLLTQIKWSYRRSFHIFDNCVFIAALVLSVFILFLLWLENMFLLQTFIRKEKREQWNKNQVIYKQFAKTSNINYGFKCKIEGLAIFEIINGKFNSEFFFPISFILSCNCLVLKIASYL